MKNSNLLGTLVLGAMLVAKTVSADNRIFTYTYEPETEPRGDWEYEQSVTLRTGRSAAVGQSITSSGSSARRLNTASRTVTPSRST
jgi:hypothetical protein